MDETAAFNKFKGLCAAENLIQNNFTAEGDDVSSGICDDGTLMYNFPTQLLRTNDLEQRLI